MSNTITIEPVTRIEGHAKITLETDAQGAISHGHLHVLEVRGFEKLVQGMELSKMPMITARICGVCPAAHHLASVNAIENGAGVTLPEEARLLREQLYMGHVLHSHALSCFVLLGPDVLAGMGAQPGERNIFHLVGSNPDLARKALRLRSIGQRIVELVGGRGIHPVTCIAGGMAARPNPEGMKNVAEWGKEALGILAEVQPVVEKLLANLAGIRTAAKLHTQPLAVTRGGVVDFLANDLVSLTPDGQPERKFPVAQYSQNMIERVMPSSYMKVVELRGPSAKPVYVGPLARLNVNQSFATPQADAMLKAWKAAGPHHSALDNIEARFIEMVHCAERIQEIAGNYKTSSQLAVEAKLKEGRYIGAVEAPRGVLIHDYTADAQGRVTAVNLIVATQFNYNSIDQSIVALAQHLQPQKNDNLLMNGVEFAMRCFDPCLSCATHAAGKMPMEIEIRHAGNLVRVLNRG